MLRFFAQVPRDPDGYFWEQLSRPVPKTELHYPDCIVLRAHRHRALVEKNRREDVEVSDFGPCYDPFVVEPALFRIFAALEPTEDAILTFANQYGDITPQLEVLEDGGISLRNWGVISKWFRDAIAESEQLVSAKASRQSRAKRAQAFAEFIDPFLAQLPVYLMPVAANGAISFRAEVRGLIDVMKVQFIESIVEQKRYRNCELCNKPFEVTPQVNRSDRIFCSDNCRVKAYQRRRKQAVDLRRAGRTLREIAKTLRSDLPTVKKWVEEVDRKE